MCMCIQIKWKNLPVIFTNLSLNINIVNRVRGLFQTTIKSNDVYFLLQIDEQLYYKLEGEVKYTTRLQGNARMYIFSIFIDDFF